MDFTFNFLTYFFYIFYNFFKEKDNKNFTSVDKDHFLPRSIVGNENKNPEL